MNASTFAATRTETALTIGARFIDPGNGKTYLVTNQTAVTGRDDLERVHVKLIKDGKRTNYGRNMLLSQVLSALPVVEDDEPLFEVGQQVVRTDGTPGVVVETQWVDAEPGYWGYKVELDRPRKCAACRDGALETCPSGECCAMDNLVWGSAPAWTAAPVPVLHAHVETDSADCDGRYTGESLLVMTVEERASDFGDIDFHNRVVASAVNTYSIERTGKLLVSKDEHGTRMEWVEATDEGYRSSVTRFCSDAGCDLGAWSTRRDHRAEAAGY